MTKKNKELTVFYFWEKNCRLKNVSHVQKWSAKIKLTLQITNRIMDTKAIMLSNDCSFFFFFHLFIRFATKTMTRLIILFLKKRWFFPFLFVNCFNKFFYKFPNGFISSPANHCYQFPPLPDFTRLAQISSIYIILHETIDLKLTPLHLAVYK